MKGASMRYKIKVTKEHIRRGTKCSGQFCPVALAIKDHKILSKKLNDIYVYSYKIDNFEKSLDIPLPEKVQNFISDFDNKRTVKPFEFFVNVPNS